MPRRDFRRRDTRRPPAGEGEFDPVRRGPKRMTLRERLLRVLGSDNPYACTEISKLEAREVVATMRWREDQDAKRSSGAPAWDDGTPGVSYPAREASIPGASYRAKKRKARYSKTSRAGCEVCESSLATMWRNAGSAARHYDATGHKCWSETSVKVWYGEEYDPKVHGRQENARRKEIYSGKYDPVAHKEAVAAVGGGCECADCTTAREPIH